MDKGLLIGLIATAASAIFFWIKGTKKGNAFYQCEIKTFKKLLGEN